MTASGPSPLRAARVTDVQLSELNLSQARKLKKAYWPKRFYRQRHKIENFFRRVKDWRRIAARYDKLAHNFLVATLMVGALYWIKL